jgi:hypothetical protein
MEDDGELPIGSAATDYRALSLFRGIHGTIVNCYLASVSFNNTLPLSSVYQVSPDIHCHLPEKSRSYTAGNNGALTPVPLSLGHALYFRQKIAKFWSNLLPLSSGKKFIVNKQINMFLYNNDATCQFT